MEMMAIRATVIGKPKDCGHQLREYMLKSLVIHMRAVRL